MKSIDYYFLPGDALC